MKNAVLCLVFVACVLFLDVTEAGKKKKSNKGLFVKNMVQISIINLVFSVFVLNLNIDIDDIFGI